VLAEDGVVVDLVDGKAEIVGAVPCGYVFVDGLEVGDVGESTLKDRRILGDEGFISVTLAVDSVTGKIAGGPEISARGFSDDRRRSTRSRRSSSRSSTAPPARASPTPTRSRSRCAAWSAAGCPTPTAAVR
jgi:mRNA degradation ribonuclease J1/J2